MENDELQRIIASNLAHYRKLTKLTQAEVAQLLNYSDKSISKWERGEGMPDILRLTQLAELYHVTLNDLISPNQKNHPPLQYWNKFLLMAMSAGLVWLVAVVAFTVLALIPSMSDLRLWLIFIYAIPISAIVTLTLSAVWKKKYTQFASASALIWSIAAGIVFTWNVPNIGMMFAIAAVLQVLAILWFFFRIQIFGNPKPKKPTMVIVDKGADKDKTE